MTATKTKPVQDKLPGVTKNPMEQKDITGKTTLHKTPPLEVVKAADYVLKKRLDVSTAKGNLDSAVENLIKVFAKHNMTQVVITDEMQCRKRIILKQGDEKIKVEKANDL